MRGIVPYYRGISNNKETIKRRNSDKSFVTIYCLFFLFPLLGARLSALDFSDFGGKFLESPVRIYPFFYVLA